MYYVNVFIDTNNRTIQTLDPLGHVFFQIYADATLIRKRIAKSFFIIDFYFETWKKN